MDKRTPRHRGRHRWPTLLLLGVLASSPALAETVERWFQIDVIVFHNDSALASSDERLFKADLAPAWPADIGMLLPAEGSEALPPSTRTLQLAWQTRPPTLTLLDFGLDADTHLATRLAAQQARLRSPIRLQWLDQLETLEWQEPEPLDPSPTEAEDRAQRTPDPAEAEPVDPAAPELERDADPALEAIAEALPEVPEVPPEWAFRAVASGERLLNAEAARLRRARDYRVLQHLSWRQPFEPDDAGQPIMIQVADGRDQLLGAVTIELRRFLHAHLDLYYRSDELAQPDQWLRVRQSRRMRSGETHYLDHPRLGVLVRIERL